MDIVTRLKTFINYIAVPVTQFADNCRIPRPTLSQLLNGRNKKVSDELIGKIHEAYPQLSVLWLMFGEGNMLHAQNNETSEPQNSHIFDFTDDEPSDNEDTAPRLDFGSGYDSEHTTRVTAEKAEAPALNSVSVDMNTPLNPDVTDTTTTVSFNSDQTKQIVNIIVYYNDNSFESFVPAHSK